jgi:predicted transcriptional regulator
VSGRSSYRSRNEIFAAILQSAARYDDGNKMTKMMYETFLSYKQFTQYVNDLIRFGMLVKIKSGTSQTNYKITDKGLAFMGLVEKMDNLLKTS